MQLIALRYLSIKLITNIIIKVLFCLKNTFQKQYFCYNILSPMDIAKLIKYKNLKTKHTLFKSQRIMRMTFR